ncbi:hypothetical protein DPSP01_011007 [Paraphaeosphaeria sporulosa]
MSEQPEKKLKFGSPEYKAFMAKKKAERQAAAANAPPTAFSPSITGDASAAGIFGIVAAIFSQATAFQVKPAPVSGPIPGTTPNFSHKVSQSCKDSEAVTTPPHAFHGGFPRAEALKAATQNPVPATSSKPHQHAVSVPQRQAEEPAQRSRDIKLTRSRSNPRPVVPRVYHDPAHLRSKDRPIAVRLERLRDELTTRGLEVQKSDKLKDYVEILTANDEEYSTQLLALEQSVLRQLWVKNKLKTLMLGFQLNSNSNYEYGLLTGVLADSFPQTPDGDALRAKLRPEAQHKILLRIANRIGAVLRPEMTDDHIYIARKIADFRARTLAAGGTGDPQRSQFQSRERSIRPLAKSPVHDRDDAPTLRKRTKRQRENDVDEEVENEAKPLPKKVRHDGSPIAIERASAPVPAGTSTGSTPELTSPSKHPATAAADAQSSRPLVAKSKKHQRGRDDEEEQEPEHKKARVTAPGNKASKKEEDTTKTASQHSVSLTKDVEQGTKPKSKGIKRQRDEEDEQEEMKPAQKRSRHQHQDSIAAEEDQKASGSGTRQRKTHSPLEAGGSDKKKPKRKNMVIESNYDESRDFIDDGSEDESAKKKRNDVNETMSRAQFRRKSQFFKD